MENELTSVVNNGSTTSFTCDAAGIRVKTVKPNGVVIDHPFPNYEVENPTAATPIRRSIYTIAGQTIATRVSGDPVNNGLTYFYNDHLGSLSALRNPSGGRSASIYYLPFGNYRGAAPTQTVTDRDFTGQPQNDYIKLIDMRARWYDPAIGRFISPDPIIPDPANPQSLNRYSYVYNNPVRYTDSSGHCVDGITTWVCIAAGIAVVTKVIDYGITAWDTYQAGRTLADPTASGSAKMMAGLTVGLSILFEAIEPDDILPVGLPIDDAARRTFIRGAGEVLEEGGETRLRKWVYDQLGDHADQVWNKFDELLGLDYILKPDVESGVLQNSLISQLFRDEDRYLGGTAGILRRGNAGEIAGHMTKAEERLAQMSNILETGMVGRGANRTILGQHDLDIVQQLYDDLLNAYNGAKAAGY